VASLTPSAPFSLKDLGFPDLPAPSTWGLSKLGNALSDMNPFTGDGQARAAVAVASAPAEMLVTQDEIRDQSRAIANAAMDRYAQGDDGAFAALYDALAPRLHQYLVRQCRDQSRADDLLQQTLLHMHRARGRFTPGAEVLPWAFAIARRLLIDSLRRGKYEVLGDGDEGRGEPAGDARGADDLLDSKRLARAVEAELQRMPEPHRVAFELIKKEGLSIKEAAAVLGTTATAVKLRAHRAYVALRAALGDAFEGR
jgi:RNA polymerase sigma-70 factor (ECF subfamily)